MGEFDASMAAAALGDARDFLEHAFRALRGAAGEDHDATSVEGALHDVRDARSLARDDRGTHLRASREKAGKGGVVVSARAKRERAQRETRNEKWLRARSG